jgi:hypothetical protein
MSNIPNDSNAFINQQKLNESTAIKLLSIFDTKLLLKFIPAYIFAGVFFLLLWLNRDDNAVNFCTEGTSQTALMYNMCTLSENLGTVAFLLLFYPIYALISHYLVAMLCGDDNGKQ